MQLRITYVTKFQIALQHVETQTQFRTGARAVEPIKVIQRVFEPVRILNEIPTGVLNGMNATFTTQHDFVPGSVEVFVNGLKQKLINDFNTTGVRTILLAQSPNSNENILVNYIKA